MADRTVPRRLYIATVFGDEGGNELITFLWFQGSYAKKDVKRQIKIDEEFDPKSNKDVAEVLETLFKKDKALKRADIDYDDFVRKYVTISRSPPSGKRITEVVKSKGSHVIIGTIVGMSAASGAGDVTLAFVTVPTGILVIGAASGLADGLREGIAKKIQKWLD